MKVECLDVAENIKMMTLIEFLKGIDKFDEDLTLYIKPSCSAIFGDTLVKLIETPEDDDDMNVEGMSSMMDVWYVSQVLQGKARFNRIDRPTGEELVGLFLEYIKTGA